MSVTKMAEPTFRIRAAYGKATLEMLVPSRKVNDIVERWTDRLRNVDLSDLEAELEQLTVNVWGAPKRIRTAHLANKRA